MADNAAVYPIGRAVALTGLSARQIRYYEQEGLLSAARSAGRQRLYTQDQVAVLQLIRRLRDEGYSLAEVRGMLPPAGAAEGAGPSAGGAGTGGAASRHATAAFPGQPEVSLYPMVNRTRLLEILDRLERRDRRDRS